MDVFDIFTGEVSKVRFATAYNRPTLDEIAPMSEESITETSYIPAEIQIRDMMEAGDRLARERKERVKALNE